VPLVFTENHGQWDDKVLYRANAGSATMWYASGGVVYQFIRTIDRPEIDSDDPLKSMPHRIAQRPDSVEQMVVKATFVGANANPIVVGKERMDYKCNYFIGHDPDEWHTDVPNYRVVIYEEVYDGIDLKYYGNGRQMEYDFIVSPGADVSLIKIEYEGVESVSINYKGELVVKTNWGEVIEQRPVIYQIDNSSRVTVAGEYSLKGANSFGFELSGYNPALPLVIDPVLSYSTYLGGSFHDYGRAIAVDGLGNAYITGSTYSTDFPTEGAYQRTYHGLDDAFVTKLSSSGNGLVYSTYLGGSHGDDGRAIAVDGSGSAYITGGTYSADFPTEGEFQSDQGSADVFVTKLSSSGNSLVYSTYLGGSTFDYGMAIAVNGLGNACITGQTNSTDFPNKAAYQGTCNGADDAFVTKLNSSGSGLVYSTYIGGNAIDRAFGLALNGSGNAYITGYTTSADFPTKGAYQTDQGSTDAFVTKLKSSGNGLVYSTYMGGRGSDYAYDIAVDVSGNAHITGMTNSTDFQIEGAHQSTFQGGWQDGFVTKLNNSGSGLAYSTYLGGSNSDRGENIAVDGSGNAYITGQTNSTDFPTEGAYQTTFQGGPDAFVTKFSMYTQDSCCVGLMGNVDCDGGQNVDIGDVTELIALLFIRVGDPYCCEDEADLDYNGDMDIGDLTILINKLFITVTDPPPCP
jgi:hypothetical protein